MIARAGEQDLSELLALMRAYCDFYEVAPSDEDLLALSRALIADPQHEGVQLIARDDGRAIGFATVYWTWSTTSAAREHGAKRLTWQTALDNERAQKLYDRIGGRRSQWLDYDLPTGGEES